VLRVGELQRWIREGHYDRVLRGEYIRRSEEPRAYREEARDAASYYGGTLKKAIRKLSRFLDEAAQGGPVEL